MSKVYVVTTGDYSDESIERAFSTNQKAEEWMGEFSKDFSVYEVDLDNFSDPNIVHARLMIMDALSGEMVRYTPLKSFRLPYPLYGFKVVKESKTDETNVLFRVVVAVYEDWSSSASSAMSGRLSIMALFNPEKSLDDATKALADIRGQLFSNNMLKPGVYDRTTMRPIYIDNGMFK